MKLKVSFVNPPEYKELSFDRFEELFQIKYLSHLEFFDWKVEKSIRKKCALAKKKGKIGDLAIWLGMLHGKELESGHIPPVAIRWIDEKIGYGLFTTQSFKKWQFIGEYTGLIRRRRLLFPDINDYCFMYPKEWISLKAYTIDSEKHGNYTRFINHSDYPNCESVSVYFDGYFHILFRTIQDVPEGTELTYDYGDIYWHKRKKLPEEKPEDLISPEDLKKIKAQLFN